ncbi:MAG TPA: hypothetical protein VK510_07425 [Solirubrobacteraceae bacterium]|jgi:hypothetical protein|nr:hypothetical protein [Solirubrobacteraceae bacterium]
MPSTKTTITTALLLSALAPAAALGAGVHSHPKLGGQPQMSLVDSHHATLKFASDRLARTADGKVDAKITFVNGAKVTAIKPVGTHGNDIKYEARVSSTKELRNHAKYTVRFRLGDSSSVQRLVKLYLPSELH